MNWEQPLTGISEQLLGEIDPAQLYDRIAQSAMVEFQADGASLMLWDEGGHRLYVAALAGRPFTLPGGSAEPPDGIAGWVISRREPLLLEWADEQPPARPDLLRNERSGLAVCAPLLAREQVLGVFSIARSPGAAPFGVADREQVAHLACQAAIAIANAQRYEQVRRRAERLAKLNSLSLALAATIDLDQLLTVVAAHLCAALPIERGYLVVRHGQPPQLLQPYPFGQGAPASPGLDELRADGGLVGRVLDDGRPRSGRVAELARRIAPWERRLARKGDQTLLCAALVTGQGICGAIEVAGWPGKRIGGEALQFLVEIAAAVAPALERVLRDAAREEGRYRVLFDHAKEAVLLIDGSASAIVEANPAAQALSGYPWSELSGMAPARLITGESADRTVIPLDTIVASGRSEFEARLHTRDGRSIPITVGLSEVAHGGSRYLLLIARDSSERQRLAKRLAQTEKLAGMSRLTSSIAHEINNPLQAIHNSLHLLLNRPLSEEKRTRYLSMAHEEAERLIAIVQRMLDFYRPSDDGMRPLSLHTLLDSVLAMVAEQFQQRGISVERDWDERLPRVSGIGSHLRHVFLNLAVNAAEAMPEGGRLLVRTRVGQGYPGHAGPIVLVEFVDTGPGLSGSAAQTIFEPFYTTKSKSIGMGLAVSYSIVERHGGTLSVSSDEGGATFRVVLPAIDGSEPAA